MERRLRRSVYFLALLLALTRMAADPTTALAEPELNDRLVTAQLANGLHVLVVESPDAPLVEFGSAYLAGPAQEEPGQEGIAHFVEHLLFQSVMGFEDGGVAREFALYGLERNGYTFAGGMYLWTRLLPEFVDRFLELESGRLRGLVFSPEELERERGVVIQELVLRGGHYVPAELELAVFRAGYQNHVYGRPIGGTVESVKALDADAILAFHERHIHPANAALIISGPVTMEELLPRLESTVGAVPARSPESPASSVDLPPRFGSSVVLDQAETDGMAVCYGIRLPASDRHDEAMAHMLAALLDGERGTSDLWSMPGERVLLHTGRWRYWLAPELGRHRPVPDEDAQRILQYVWEGITSSRRLFRDEVSMERVRDKTLEYYDRLLRSSARLRRWGFEILRDEIPITRAELDSVVRTITPEQAQAYFSEHVDPNRVSKGVMHGRDSERKIELDLKGTRPSGGAISAMADPLEALDPSRVDAAIESLASSSAASIHRHELSNGIPVYLIPRARVDWLELSGLRTFPELHEESPKKMPGVSWLYSRVANYDPSPPRKKLKVGENPPTPKLPHSTKIDLRPFDYSFQADGNSDELGELADLLCERLVKDRFNTARWNDVLRFAETSFELMDSEPMQAARMFRWESHLGVDHPYLRQWSGEIRTLERIRYKDLQKLHRKVAATGNLRLFLSGDFDEAAALVQLEERFGELDEHRGADAGADIPPRLEEMVGRVFPAFDLEPVVLSLSFPPITRAAAEQWGWAEIDLLTELLSTRLRAGLRQQRGLVYYAWAYPVVLGDAVGIELRTACAPSELREVHRALKELLWEFTQHPMEEPGFARGQLSTMSKLMSEMLDPADAADQARWISRFGLVPERPVAAIAQLQAEDLQRAIDQLLPNDRYALSLVGPILEEELEGLGLR